MTRRRGIALAAGVVVWLALFFLLRNPWLGLVAGPIVSVGGPLGYLWFAAEGRSKNQRDRDSEA